MKSFKIVSAILLASTVSSTAMAAEGDAYARVDAGYSLASAKISGDSNQTLKPKGFIGNVGVGYYYTDNVRVDVNLGFSPDLNKKIKKDTLNGSKIKLKSYTGMVNAYYDFVGSELTPYITVGLGIENTQAKIKGSTNVSFKSKTSFAYQAGLGAAYEVASGTFLDLGYRFSGTGSQKLKAKNGLNYKLKPKYTNSFLLGLRVNF